MASPKEEGSSIVHRNTRTPEDVELWRSCRRPLKDERHPWGRFGRLVGFGCGFPKSGHRTGLITELPGDGGRRLVAKLLCKYADKTLPFLPHIWI